MFQKNFTSIDKTKDQIKGYHYASKDEAKLQRQDQRTKETKETKRTKQEEKHRQTITNKQRTAKQETRLN